MISFKTVDEIDEDEKIEMEDRAIIQHAMVVKLPLWLKNVNIYTHSLLTFQKTLGY